MNNSEIKGKQELDLDPQDWSAVKELGHQMIDDMIDYMSGLDEEPVWRVVPEDVKQQLQNTIPHKPTDPKEIYEEFKRNILPYSIGNAHPRFFSWVEGNGTPMGALAEFLASAMNPNVGIGEQSAMYVENQVLEWCKQMLGFPQDSSGILLSGATMANITAMLVARNHISEKVKVDGLKELPAKLTAYCSSETHNCIIKAMEIIGVGNKQLRKIPVNNRYQIDTEALKTQIEYDKKEGFIPFCIIGNAGSVNTGAIDPMDELLHIARDHNLWFHVDGAFGSLAKMVPEYQERLEALEEADSIAFDLHKWMYMPYEVGCVLVRDSEIHRKTFVTHADYLVSHERGLAAGPETFSHFGMELSRGFKALKVWMSLKEHGLEKYRKLIAQNIEQANLLGAMIKDKENLEGMADITLNIVCYRYNPEGLAEHDLNKLNKELLMRLHESGIAAPSYTMLNGSYVLRVSITNHRTKRKDLERLVDATLKIGEVILEEQFLSGT